jgi:hypothetical protein
MKTRWTHLLQELKRRQGMTIKDISLAINVPRTTVMGYKNDGAEPKHSIGERLLALQKPKAVDLPPLPEPAGDGYTATEVMEFALAAVLAERDRRRQ